LSAHARYGVPNVAPAVGMPATVCIGSDRYPATVSAVLQFGGRRRLSILVQIDGDATGGCERYVASREQQGVYDAADGCGRRAYVGRADSYRDPHA
jgi:hypothetical protein